MEVWARVVRGCGPFVAVIAVVLASQTAGAALDPTVDPSPQGSGGVSGTASGFSGWVSTSVGTIRIGTNFTGTALGQSAFIPPDTMGAVGPGHIMELINGRAAYYQKDGTFLSGQSLNDFWTDAGVTPAGAFAFDPRVVYDPSSSRWFAAAVDNNGGANNYLLGVSHSSDPTAGWTGFALDSDTDDKEWADFPTLGVTGDRVTLAGNMVAVPGAGGSSSVSLLTLPKADLLAGTPTVANATLIEGLGIFGFGGTSQPVMDLDYSTGDQRLLSGYSKALGSLKSNLLMGTPESPSLFPATWNIPVTARNSPGTIDQPDPSATPIQSGDERFSGSVVQRQLPGRANPSMWAVHGIDLNGQAALEWYEIDAVTTAVLQSGTISDVDLAFNYPSISVNQHGDVVIGFSGGGDGAGEFMSAFVVVGKTDGGVTSFSDPILTKAGADNYQRNDSRGRNRWGDYSAVVLDPSDPSGKTFWTFQEFVAPDGTGGLADNVWATQITQVLIPEPGTAVLTLVGLVWVVARRRGRHT